MPWQNRRPSRNLSESNFFSRNPETHNIYAGCIISDTQFIASWIATLIIPKLDPCQIFYLYDSTADKGDFTKNIF